MTNALLLSPWEDPLEKEMATHSSILAWEIPWTEESGGLQSMGSQRVRHDLVTKKLGATFVIPKCVLPDFSFYGKKGNLYFKLLLNPLILFFFLVESSDGIIR